jgi:acid phosphatase (class A)
MLASRRSLLAVSFALGLAGPAFAKDPYVSSEFIDLSMLLPPPPAIGTPEGAADLQAVLDAQAHASEARKAQAIADAGETVFVMFTPVLGEKFNTEALPKLTKLFERINDSESATVNPAKLVFAKPRPWIASSAVVPMPKPSKSFSYPSGHTTRVTMSAIILSAMLPEQKDAIWARAADYAESRVIAGEHYPSDLVGGERSGSALAALMWQEPNFRADFEDAKAEVREALKAN